MYTYPWYHWITFFYIYCFFGWIFESAYVSLGKKHFVNRGFLRLPMLPLYGTGAVMMLWVSLPVQDNLLLVYIAGVIAATILEYITGYVMERLFKMKYWDYSSQRFNLHGYICLSSSIAWGFLTIFLTKVIHRPIANLVLGLNPMIEFPLIGIISLLFLSDSVKSVKAALDLGRALETMTKIRAELDDIQVQLALLRAETGQKVAEFKEDASLRATVLREDASQKVTEFREDAALRVAELKEETLLRAAEAAERIKTRSERESALSDRLKALTESQQKLSHQMSFYRLGILKGNPSASSKRFAEALKELKDSVSSRKEGGENRDLSE